eukprot:TRINITY_DN31166_c0_g1_i1.p1 TRINITY_DN31166_c0_g1~~TRINITY_DN31166_c0_g1_i1.p1  ORF type:complete len:355 (+),score=62.73 TRINITY_DN31166_c0_g1_i1:60-1067(+)
MVLQFERGCSSIVPEKALKESNERKRKRGAMGANMQVFQKRTKSLSVSVSPSPSPPPVPIVGTSQELEKTYRRGEGNVEPSQVRPLEILDKSFNLVVSRKESNLTTTYPYIKDQLKSIRQDLLVQNIRTEFSWKVYLFALKEALLNKDVDEVSQCLTQLKGLEKIEGLKEGCVMEVKAYRLLFYCLRENTMVLQKELGDLTKRSRAFGCIKHAIAFVNSYCSFDYCMLKKLILRAPKQSMQVITIFLPTLREAVLLRILKAYRTLTKPELSSLLFFPSESSVAPYMKSFGCQLTTNENGVQQLTCCKAALDTVTATAMNNINPQFKDLEILKFKI